MSPQPRPRSKGPRPEPEPPEGEVLTPDAVWTDDEEPIAADAPPAKPYRRGLWALVLGLSAVWFFLLASPVVVVLSPAAAIFGWRTMKDIDAGNGPQQERRKARIGFIAGVALTVILVLQIAYNVFLFEWDKTPDDIELNDEKTETTVPAGEPSGEPEG